MIGYSKETLTISFSFFSVGNNSLAVLLRLIEINAFLPALGLSGECIKIGSPAQMLNVEMVIDIRSW